LLSLPESKAADHLPLTELGIASNIQGTSTPFESKTRPPMSEEPTESGPEPDAADFTTIESIFVRHRNCLLLRGQFTPIYIGHYLHLKDHDLRYNETLDQGLKDLLAVLTLHLCARPWAETIAWTANLRAPRVNFFATGASLGENITSR
jgi:hypothetical protein